MSWLSNFFKSAQSRMHDTIDSLTALIHKQQDTIQQQAAVIASPPVQAAVNAAPTPLPAQPAVPQTTVIAPVPVAPPAPIPAPVIIPFRLPVTPDPYTPVDWRIPPINPATGQSNPGGNGGIVTIRSKADEQAFIAKYGGPGEDFAVYAERLRQENMALSTGLPGPGQFPEGLGPIDPNADPAYADYVKSQGFDWGKIARAYNANSGGALCAGNGTGQGFLTGYLFQRAGMHPAHPVVLNHWFGDSGGVYGSYKFAMLAPDAPFTLVDNWLPPGTDHASATGANQTWDPRQVG